MQNFNAVISVAEDTKFRKTVLDAIERKTEEMLPIYISSSLNNLIARRLDAILTPQMVEKVLREEAAKQIVTYINNDPAFSALMHQYYEAAKAEVATKVEDLMSKATENIIRKAMMFMGR